MCDTVAAAIQPFFGNSHPALFSSLFSTFVKGKEALSLPRDAPVKIS
jgi:hypothetical protein